MRTAVWEAASQIALRDCSKVPVGESQYIRFSWKGNSIPWRTFYKRFFASHEDLMSPWRDLVLLYIWEDARIEIIKSVPKNIQLSKDLSHQIPWSTECLTPPWSLRGCWRSIAVAARGSISAEADGKGLWCSVIGNSLGKCHFVVDISVRCSGLILVGILKEKFWGQLISKQSLYVIYIVLRRQPNNLVSLISEFFWPINCLNSFIFWNFFEAWNRL